MKTRSLIASSLLLACWATFNPRPASAQDRMITVFQSGTYTGVVSDYLQVKFIAQAIPGKLGELKVTVKGDGVQKVAVFPGAIQGTPTLPGGQYYLIALFRCEKTGSSTVRIDEIANGDGKILDTTFSPVCRVRVRCSI